MISFLFSLFFGPKKEVYPNEKKNSIFMTYGDA